MTLVSFYFTRPFDVEKFVPVLFTKTESSDGKWQKLARQFQCRGILKFPCICNVNGANIAMITAYSLKFASTIYRGYMPK